MNSRYWIALSLVLIVSQFSFGEYAPGNAPFINTWLILGPFVNDSNCGYDRQLIDEMQVSPADQMISGGKKWHYFDDRLFSRNYDDYQDFFSYFTVKCDKSFSAKIVYAHVYIYSTTEQRAQLRVGAYNQFKAWLNGELVASDSTPWNARKIPQIWDKLVSENSYWQSGKDLSRQDVDLKKGWNRLLLKVGTPERGRVGFYCRFSDGHGDAISGLTYSVNGGTGDLAVATQGMKAVTANTLPVAFREWPYVGAVPTPKKETAFQWYSAMQASRFCFQAQGGQPPYTWSISKGLLPKGLALSSEGAVEGTVSFDVELKDYQFEICVEDAEGKVSNKEFLLTVKERPNKWYEEARLVALIHAPENMPSEELPRFAKLMKRQGYQAAMPISYNNGDMKFRWPSFYDPNNAVGDVIGKYKRAIEAEGIKFGMYFGNLDIGPAEHGGINGSVLLVRDAMIKYKPDVVWFDWAAYPNESVDALCSVVRSCRPDAVIVLNGVERPANGDWDILSVEGWGAYKDSKQAWDPWPADRALIVNPTVLTWPKKHSLETWRLVGGSSAEYDPASKDWKEYLRLQISLIGSGFIANMDHSPLFDKKTKFEDSPGIKIHRLMADWVSPGDVPPLYSSYTNVNPGPLEEADWGYNTINLKCDTIYLHLLSNPQGKKGMPDANTLTVGPVAETVKSATWMNRNQPIQFRQDGSRLVLDVDKIEADPVDIIIKIVLEKPLAEVPNKMILPKKDVLQTNHKPGNLASHKPAKLLDPNGTKELTPSTMTCYAYQAVDDSALTPAVGAFSWAWMLHLDLEEQVDAGKIVILFGKEDGYPTEYEVLVSLDGTTWDTIAHICDFKGGEAVHALPNTSLRYVRVRSIKPDAPGQLGSQMQIYEIEVYAADKKGRL